MSMTALIAFVVVAQGSGGSSSGDPAAARQEPKWLTPSEIRWSPGPPSLAAGASSVVLEGSLTEPGPFVIRIRLPKGFRIMPHKHSGPERVTVLSGTYTLAIGKGFDPRAGKKLTAGSFAITPAGLEHFAYTDTGCVLQVHGVGPWNIQYLDPKHDPRIKPPPSDAGAGKRGDRP